jgi:hypothetical protein
MPGRLHGDGHWLLGLAQNSLKRVAATPQRGFELVMVSFGNLMQQVPMIFLQNLEQQIVLFVGQPQFHGDLHFCAGSD